MKRAAGNDDDPHGNPHVDHERGSSSKNQTVGNHGEAGADEKGESGRHDAPPHRVQEDGDDPRPKEVQNGLWEEGQPEGETEVVAWQEKEEHNPGRSLCWEEDGGYGLAGHDLVAPETADSAEEGVGEEDGPWEERHGRTDWTGDDPI